MAESEETPPVHHYLGDKELSDVVLVFKGQEYHAHKMLLAARSPYFKRLFFSDEAGKSAKVFQMSEFDMPCEGVSFGYRIMFSALYSYDDVGLHDPPICSAWPINAYGDVTKAPELRFSNVWYTYSPALRLAKKYEVVKIVRNFLEQRMLFIYCGDTSCLTCTMRLLVAVHFKMERVFHRLKMDKDCIALCLNRLSPISDEFFISPSLLSSLFKRIGGLTFIRIPRANKDQLEEVPSLKIYAHGDSQLSDVTLIVGNSEFKTHKMFLAARSSYFRAMFFSNFSEKGKDRVTIQADEVAFKHMMELLYNGSFYDNKFLDCVPNEGMEAVYTRIQRFWRVVAELLKLLDLFDISNSTLQMLMCAYSCGKENCFECAYKRLLAWHFKLNTVKDRVKSSPKAIASCLRNFPECLPEQLAFDPKDLAGLIESMSE